MYERALARPEQPGLSTRHPIRGRRREHPITSILLRFIGAVEGIHARTTAPGGNVTGFTNFEEGMGGKIVYRHVCSLS
jgi:hypothetical protein